MSKYWSNLNEREKLLVSVATLLVLLIFSWQFLIKPISSFGPSQQKQYAKSLADLEIMQKGISTLSAVPTTRKSNLPVTKLMTEVTRSAGQNGLMITRRQPNGETGISLWFEQAPSPKFYRWLDELTSAHHVTLMRASINRNNDGTIQAQVTLKLGT